ncbi:hypothetical protein F53441_1246 [Fusarium austroafricanum]|uniref:Zn(2)-C6 fungal-type domain-containing protein n=1 Tax=Fusarium austroafricanum TaxID=2364996 RepID=A0A8H4P2G8_9HYPO|nr:hypothetical protein F53441_1246 [Fusarium austroafricanum]
MAPRKACDICYVKRIRCDGQKPRCSHCVLYNTECTFQAASRKSRPAKKGSTEDTAALQRRVQQLEATLKQAQDKADKLESQLAQEKEDNHADITEHEVSLTGDISREMGLELPSQADVLSATDKYLKTLNCILPLFNSRKLLQCVNKWYEQPHERNISTWAAINVVLALAHRQISANEAFPTNNTVHFLNNAQSALNDIMLGEPKLLSVQILLGMVVLLQATSDLKPASALIAITLRIAHGLGLHAQSYSDGLSLMDALERNRVFWIAYILDRDLAMRTRLPPIQSQADISIEWPLETPVDEAGIVHTADGTSSFNFFLSRVQLAHIQGEVYETMLSMSPTTPDVRLENVARIHRMLDEWQARIPAEFSASSILQSQNSNLCRVFGVLYSSHLACRSCVCKVNAMEAHWIPELQEFGRKAAEGVIASPRVPEGWQKLVHETREFINLFVAIQNKDPAFIWMTACTYISGAVCLTANNLFNPLHTQNYLFSIHQFTIILILNFYAFKMASPPFPTLTSFTKTWHKEPYPFISPTRPELSAAGKNIVITGGGTGIGQATGIAFAQAGAKSVAIVGRRLDRLEVSAKGIQAVNPSTQVLFETGDVAKGTSITTTFNNIVENVGKIDILVANAGMLPADGSVSDYDESKLQECIQTNFMGAFNSLQAFLPLAAPEAQVFYIGSGISHWALFKEVPGVFAYAAAKSAALKMVDFFAHENPHIHVVGIQPGIIATGINPNPEIGWDTVELPARFMVWLASNEARFLKGKFVWANWDAQELLDRADEIKSSLLLRVTLKGVDM